MLGWVDLDREQLRDITRILIPGIAAAALLLPALA
jgi:hypothetical protein